jgi:signal transduction histidine kinase
MAETVSRHKCLIYEGRPSEQLPVIVPLLLEGLRENYRCLYLAAPESVSMLRAALKEKGVDPAALEKAGALVLSSDRSHLDGGKFRPRDMVESLRSSAKQAVRDGFAGLCATGDMRWELGGDENFEALLEYEALLEAAFKDLPLRGICQYHRDTVPSRAVRDALLTHSCVHLGGALNEDNLFYLPPELLAQDGAVLRDKQGEWMWAQLSRLLAAERQRDAALDELRVLNQELEQRVRERTAELEGSNRELEAFGSSVSHDLRAPLRAIDGFTRTIEKRHASGFTEDDKTDFRLVRDGVKRMGAMIDGLLALSRARTGEMKPAEVDLSAEAERALADLRSAEPGRDVQVLVEPGLRATGDARLLAVLVANLLSNAWKFTGRSASPRIEFRSENRSGRRYFSVRDNGAGFDAKQGHRLFKPFERLHSAKEFPGSGIGLATCRRIVERHGGEINAEPLAGGGAAFLVYLP